MKYSRHGFEKEINRQVESPQKVLIWYVKAYIVSAHHTMMYISTVHISESYMQGCDDGQLKEDDFFVVRRSRVWDLGDPSSRIDAAMAFLTVLNYTMSSN